MATFTIIGPSQQKDFPVSPDHTQKLINYAGLILGAQSTNAERELFVINQMPKLLAREVRRFYQAQKAAAAEAADPTETISFNYEPPA